MDKHMEIFCAQNPKFELECDNPECKPGGIHVFASKDVFKSNIFTFKCEDKEIQFDTKEFSDSVKVQLKKAGIKW